MKIIRLRIIQLVKPGIDLYITYEGNLISLNYRPHEDINLFFEPV